MILYFVSMDDMSSNRLIGEKYVLVTDHYILRNRNQLRIKQISALILSRPMCHIRDKKHVQSFNVTLLIHWS